MSNSIVKDYSSLKLTVTADNTNNVLCRNYCDSDFAVAKVQQHAKHWKHSLLEYWVHLSKITQIQSWDHDWKSAIIRNSLYKPVELPLLDAVITLAFSTRLSSIGAIEKNGFRSCGSSERNLYITSKTAKQCTHGL